MRVRLTATATVFLAAGAFFGSAMAGAAPTPPVPSADQLTGQLRQVLNTGAGDAERAGYLQGGQSAVATADNIANSLNRYGGIVNWSVQNPTLNGDQLDAQLAVSIPLFGTKTHNIFWVPADGTWKLSNASACVIATQVAGTDCTV